MAHSRDLIPKEGPSICTLAVRKSGRELGKKFLDATERGREIFDKTENRQKQAPGGVGTDVETCRPQFVAEFEIKKCDPHTQWTQNRKTRAPICSITFFDFVYSTTRAGEVSSFSASRAEKW